MARGNSNGENAGPAETWPPLPLSEWRQTAETLRRWTQVVGKVKLALSPPQNHWWQVTLYVSPRGLSTSAFPCGERSLQVDFDLLEHDLVITCSDGRVKAMPLVSRTVASFYEEFQAVLRALDVHAHVWSTPVEISDPIPFEQDDAHRTYDPVFADRFRRVLIQADALLKAFAGRFQGKQSPVQFFWGSFDLACTRFSGRPAPERPGADRITREAYSHEVMSFGFWPGGGAFDDAAFYAYAVPEPTRFREAPIRPAGARYVPELSEFIFPYAHARRARSPRQAVLEFFQSAYDAGATLATWDRAALDRPAPPGLGSGEAKRSDVHPSP